MEEQVWTMYNIPQQTMCKCKGRRWPTRWVYIVRQNAHIHIVLLFSNNDHITQHNFGCETNSIPSATWGVFVSPFPDICCLCTRSHDLSFLPMLEKRRTEKRTDVCIMEGSTQKYFMGRVDCMWTTSFLSLKKHDGLKWCWHNAIPVQCLDCQSGEKFKTSADKGQEKNHDSQPRLLKNVKVVQNKRGATAGVTMIFLYTVCCVVSRLVLLSHVLHVHFPCTYLFRCTLHVDVHVGVTLFAHFSWKNEVLNIYFPCFLLFEVFDFSTKVFMFFASRRCFKHFSRLQSLFDL